MAENVILVFDIGKTNKKYFLINEGYHIVEQYSEQFVETEDEDGFPCDDIALITSWVTQTANKLLASGQWRIIAINFTAYGASFVHLNGKGRVVAPLYNYLKPYPDALKDRFYARYGDPEDIAMQTASPVLGSLNSGMQLYRLKHERPGIFSQIACSLHLPQYLGSIITGQFATEITSIGCHTQLWDFSKNAYHPWVISEGLDALFPKLQPASDTCAVGNAVVGRGLHDSSAALIPYLLTMTAPFVLLSTGTWCITLNPFNHEPLTRQELRSDCLCYLRHDGRPVKASRLFAGYYHDKAVDRIAAHFHVNSDFCRALTFNAEYIAGKACMEHATSLDAFGPAAYHTAAEAYHCLMDLIVRRQATSIDLALGHTPVKRIIVEGGFAGNDIFVKLLARAYPYHEVFTAAVAHSTAIGAALAIHNNWNQQQIPQGLVTLRRVTPM